MSRLVELAYVLTKKQQLTVSKKHAKVKDLYNYPLYYIELYDHSQDSGWKEIDKLEMEPAIIKVVGWIVKEDEKMMYISQGYDPIDNYCLGWFCLLKADILKKVKIKL